jgi:predicted nuclease of predicted toxin-antitoxin system
VKFIIDNQLPLALAKWLQSRGEDAVHVIEREQAKADDRCIWSDAIR